MLRSLLRRLLYTPNTIRYRVEWPRLESVFQQIGPVNRLFDGGAGSGEFAKRALQKGYCEEVIALEYDASNFHILQKNLGGYKTARLIQGSLLEVPLESESVDVAMSTQVIEHIVEHEKAASELVRTVKPGGYVIVTVPHPPEPFPNDGHVREGYTEADLRALFEPRGLKLLKTDYFLTQPTIHKMMQMAKLPLKGRFVPVAWVDRERSYTAEQRKECEPFGILALFRKEN